MSHHYPAWPAGGQAAGVPGERRRPGLFSHGVHPIVPPPTGGVTGTPLLISAVTGLPLVSAVTGAPLHAAE